MDMDRVRIADVITAEYSDFLSFCSASGKIFISELTNVDFVAFRTSSGQSRDYIKSIRAMLDNPVVVATTEVDAVRKGSESEKNELQGVLFDAGKYLALEDQSTPSKTESPSWIQPTEQPVKNLEAVLDETSCSDTENDTENETADRTTEEFVVTSIGTETTASSSTGPSDDSEYTLAYLFDVNPLWFEDVGIIALNLGVRPTNCLNNAKIKTIAEVLVRTTDELKAIKNMGAKSVNEIVQKVKDYVSDPANLDVETISAVSNHVSKHERVELDPAFKSTLEAMLTGDEYSTEGFSDNQRGHFEKLKDASEVVGEDICLESYLNPEYVLTICNVLMEFATPYIQYRNAMNEAAQKIGNLPDSMRQLKAMPFIRAYSATAGEKLSYLLSECSDDTTVEHKLFNAIVESVRRAVSDAGLTYTGAESLSDKVLTILKHPETSAFNFQGAFNKYRGKFTEYSSVDSIVKDLEELDLEDMMSIHLSYLWMEWVLNMLITWRISSPTLMSSSIQYSLMLVFAHYRQSQKSTKIS